MLTFLFALALVAGAVGEIDIPEIQGPQASADPDEVLDIKGPRPAIDLTHMPTKGLQIEADRVRFVRAEQVVYVEGRVQVRSAPFVVLADRLRIDFAQHRIDAEGRVRIIEGSRLLACQQATVRMPSGAASLEGVRFEIRETPVPVERAQQLDALGRSWPGALWLFGSASRVERKAGGALVLRDAVVTPCDCRDGSPSWKLRSARVDVVANNGAWARWPVVYFGEVPVMALPVWYVPLSDRQSGLLAPKLQLRDGLWLVQPIYLTLGRSADLTVGPGFILQRGPRLELEGRWAPRAGSTGFVRVVGQWDEKYLNQYAAHRDGWLWAHRDSGENISAARGALHLYHRTVEPRLAAVIDARLSSDRRVASDFGNSLGARIEPYVRSAAQLSYGAFDQVVFGAGAATYQDLRQQALLFVPSPGRTPYRAPWLFVRSLPLLLGPLAIEARADFLRVGEWGEGPASPRVPDALPSAWRASARVDASVVTPLAGVVVAQASSGFRQALILDDGGELSPLGVWLTGAELHTRLSRSYVDGARRWRHSMEPFVRYAGVSGLWRGSRLDPVLVDEADRFVLSQQLLAGLRTTLSLDSGERRDRVLRLQIMQGLDARRVVLGATRDGHDLASLSDTYLTLDSRYRRLHARLLLSVDPTRAELGALLSRIDLHFASGLRFNMSYDYLGSGSADQLYATADELFGDVAIPISALQVADRFAASCSLSPIEGTVLSYGAELALVAGRQGAIFDRVLTHGGELRYRSSCKCWEVGLRARFWPDREWPDLGLVLTISGFGEQIRFF